MIAPGRGELEWFPVSNPALCRVVGMREDGRSMRLFRGPRRTYSLPLGSPNWGFTAHVGGRAPSRVHTWVSPIFSLGCFSALCLHVSHAKPGLNCIVLSSQLCCLRVVCINSERELRAPWVIAPRRGELKRAPASNLALCQVVGMREDGRSSRIFRGWRHARFSSTLVAPWLAHLGVHRPRWRAHSLPSSYMGPALLLFLWLYRSSLPTCVSVRSPALYCIVFTAVLLTCVCVLT